MLLIGENIHIISKKTRTAIQERDEDFIKDLALRQKQAGIDYIDLNIGPARRESGTMIWLINTVLSIVDTKLSLDTTNAMEMEEGLKLVSGKFQPIVNSASGDPERLNKMMSLAGCYNAKIIGLTMDDQSGIPKDPDGRLEIAMTIVEKAAECGVDNENILLDPLVLPIGVSQDQAIETLNSIRVFKEAFDPPVMTTIGLSNISNGSPKENRPLINRIFFVMAMGCGLDSAIVDAFDTTLRRYVQIIISGKPSNPEEQLIIDLYNMMKDFGNLEDINYNKNDPDQLKFYKTAEILLNKNIYAHNYLNI